MARIISLLFCLMLGFTAISALAADPVTTAPTSAEVSDKKLNNRYLPENEVKQITIDNQPYDLLVRAWEGKKKLGAAIILPATNGTADAPGLMAFVRRNINPAGWASLSLTPPTELPAANFATAATEVTSPGAAQLSSPSNKPSPKIKPEDNSKHLQEQEDFLVQSMSQLDAVGADYAGKRILITADQSAGLLISLLSQKKIADPDVLIVINPYREDEKLNQVLAEQLAKLTLPILDIQSPDGHPASLETAANRKVLAVTLESPNYRQTRLALNLDNESAWQNCLNAIKGFAARMSGAQ
ncbi:MAG: alpha/beta hydrolase family protein [Gammaproteobacteria bacterium]|nr:alpha/beta hydrolase family protein [Gammaproteobacteria bacterium]MBU2299761.1 alpha/beta hydrolase family protein [Gammaproteobacteria bacterium]